MITVNFIRTNNDKVQVEVPEGTTLMEAAKQADLNEIPGDCGGNCSCCTCHVHINNAWVAKVGKVPYNSVEESLIEYEGEFRPGQSRLSCQIKLTNELDGLTVHLIDDELL